MRSVLPVDQVLKTIQECERNVERMQRVLSVASPNDMDQYEALRDLRLRCADSIHTIKLWSRKGLPELTFNDDPSVGGHGGRVIPPQSSANPQSAGGDENRANKK